MEMNTFKEHGTSNQSLFITASKLGRIEAVTKLLESDTVDVNESCFDIIENKKCLISCGHENALHETSDLEIVKILIKNGVDVYDRGCKPFYDAVMDKKYDIANFIFGIIGSKIRDSHLIWMIYNDRLEQVEFMLKLGANIHAYDDSALYLADYYSHTDMKKLLLRYGANEDSLKRKKSISDIINYKS
jgi:hypothetical protein